MAVFRYPLRKLDNAEDYIQIDILDYKSPGIGLNSDNNNQISIGALPSSDDTYADLLKGYDNVQDIRCSVLLPIGNSEIKDGITVGWGDDRRNPLQAAGLNLAGTFLKEGAVKAYKDAIAASKPLKDEVTSALGQKGAMAAFAGAAVNALAGGGNVNSALSRETGAIFNPNIELLFTQVNLRSAFTFSFDMIPRFQKESDEVKRIIREFKQSMSPRRNRADGARGAGIFIRSPHVFRLRYMSGGRIHPYLNRFKICALTGMNVNYNGTGPYSTYSDGTPVHMKMTLVFQELTPIYAEDYDQGQGRGGTGY